MAERMVTLQDIEKYPQLISQGVSLNMLYDFDNLEATEQDESPVTIEEKPKKNPAKKAAAKKTSKKK